MRFRAIRTDVGVDVSLGAGAVVDEIQESTAVDQPEVVLDGVLASCNVGTEPGDVSSRAAIEIRNVSVSVAGIGLGVRGGDREHGLPGR